MVDVAAANEEATTVREAGEREAPACAAALAQAFFDDPVFNWVLREDPRRLKTLDDAFELFLRRLWLAHEQTYTTAQGVGAAVWEPPGQWRYGVATQLRLLPAMLGVFRRHLPRVLRALTTLEAAHPAGRSTRRTSTSRSSASIRRGRDAGSARRFSRRCSRAAIGTACPPSSRPRRRATARCTNATDSTYRRVQAGAQCTAAVANVARAAIGRCSYAKLRIARRPAANLALLRNP